jgi:pimeloyl-ACP methyl ester carboxylesterase
MTRLRSFFAFTFVLAAPHGTALAADLPKVETFNSNGVKIAYFTEGKGEPVVLIHGWLSSAGINWALPEISGQLAKNYQVIALDVRGHGLSDKPEKEAAYGLELVEDVKRLLDHLKIKKAHIVGYSMGGFIAAKFISKHPDRVLSGTLCGSGWLRDGSVEQKVFAAGGKDKKPAGLCFQSVAKLALTEDEIKKIKVPVTLLIGEKDVLKLAYVDPLAKLRKDWPVVEIKDGDHISCVAKEQFRDEIAVWLRKNSK